MAKLKLDKTATVFVVICYDRHVDDAITVHATRESADAEIEAFKASYADRFSDGSTYAWHERAAGQEGFGPRVTWIRYVGTDLDDGPTARIELREVQP